MHRQLLVSPSACRFLHCGKFLTQAEATSQLCMFFYKGEVGSAKQGEETVIARRTSPKPGAGTPTRPRDPCSTQGHKEQGAVLGPFPEKSGVPGQACSKVHLGMVWCLCDCGSDHSKARGRLAL